MSGRIVLVGLTVLAVLTLALSGCGDTQSAQQNARRGQDVTSHESNNNPDRPEKKPAPADHDRSSKAHHGHVEPAVHNTAAATNTGAKPDHPKTAAAELTKSRALPRVELTKQHAQSCRVGVGDALPAMTLTDLDGKSRPLSETFGSALTVVVFWNSSNPYALEELTDLASLVAVPYGERGVKVVAVNVGEPIETVQAIAKRKAVAVPILCDPKGESWAALSSSAVAPDPRTYLVDKTGKVLWFDVEYSRTTRRDLAQALRVLVR